MGFNSAFKWLSACVRIRIVMCVGEYGVKWHADEGLRVPERQTNYWQAESLSSAAESHLDFFMNSVSRYMNCSLLS